MTLLCCQDTHILFVCCGLYVDSTTTTKIITLLELIANFTDFTFDICENVGKEQKVYSRLG